MPGLVSGFSLRINFTNCLVAIICAVYHDIELEVATHEISHLPGFTCIG